MYQQINSKPMSGLGMLAAAIGGASNALNQQATGDIEQKRRIDIAAETAAIEEQMRMRLAENQERLRLAGRSSDFAFDNDPTNVGTRQATAKSNTLAQGEATRAAAVTASGDTAYQGALDTEASRAGARTRRSTVDSAADPEFMKANWVVAMSDPRVKAAYTASMASAGASAAQSRVAGEQFSQLVQTGAVATKIRGLQSQLSQAADPAARDAIQQQISDLGFNGKDPAKFLSLAEKAQDNVTAALKVMMDPMSDDTAKEAAKLQMERATELSTKAAAMGGIQLSVRYPEPTPDSVAFLKRHPEKAASFDEKFGKGAAEKVLAGKAAAPPAPMKKAAGMLAPPSEPRPQDSAEALALDAARLVADNARARFYKFGSAQKQRDPEGFRAAQAEFERANAARKAAEDAYRATLGDVGPAYRYPSR